jgi:hypothetical protein
MDKIEEKKIFKNKNPKQGVFILHNKIYKFRNQES